MIERAKQLVFKNCLDFIPVTNKRIINYFKKSKHKDMHDYICGVPESTIYLDDAVTEALKELVEKGVAVKVSGKYRTKPNS